MPYRLVPRRLIDVPQDSAAPSAAEVSAAMLALVREEPTILVRRAGDRLALVDGRAIFEAARGAGLRTVAVRVLP